MLSDQEKIRIYEAARKAIHPSKLMLAGTGGQSTRETVDLTVAAAAAGADAVVVLNPFYYKGMMNIEALVAHYHEVADRSPVPVIIYNMPANTGIDMTAETIHAISEHENIIGLKDSGGNLVKMGEIISRAKPGFQVLAGSAGFLLPALLLGAVGGILALANIAPAQCLQIYHSFLISSLDHARKMQLAMIPLNNFVTREQGVPALKAAMDRLGLYGGPCRKPVLPLKDRIMEELNAVMEKAGLDRFV
jgi:4-hydroxy-2-oxoglutarate aldolase